MALCFHSKRLSKEGGVPCVVTLNTIINREKKEANLRREITSSKRVNKLT